MNQMRTLGDICEFDKQQGMHQGLPYLGLEHIESGTGRFFLTGANPDAKSSTFRFSDKHVLYGRLRPYLKKVALPDRDGRCSTEIFPILPRSSVDRRYLSYWFMSDATTDAINATCTGARMPRANMDEVLDFKLFVPSAKEQQRIVAILDEAFTAIAIAKASAEKNLQNARAIFESHVQSIFTRRGEGWVDRRLASLCHDITVGHVGPMKTEYKSDGIPFLRSQNIRPFEISMDKAMFIDAAFHLALKKSRLRPGDLAIVRTGYPGTAAVIPPDLPDSNCSDLVIVRPGDEVNAHFLAAFFNSVFGKELVLGKVVGAAQKHFNVTAAKDVMLHVPPMTEQLEIIGMIDSLRAETQRLESLYQRKLAALDALKQSLLHQAFSGQL